MAALISSVMSTKDKVPFFVNRCEEMGIEVLPPDVNASDHGFVVVGGKHPLRPRRGQERRPLGGRGDHRRAETAGASVDLGLLRAGRRARGEQAGDRVPGQVRRARLDRRHAQGDARGAARAPGASGQKAQEDARSGQGSIFDLGRRRRRRAGAVAAASTTPPSGAEEFDQRELLRLEKETLGTFLSAHPLAEVRDALRARVDCSLADSAGKQDGAWVTVGGIVTRGEEDPHQERRADDVRDPRRPRGPVEMLVFDTAYEATPRRSAPTASSIVRGRVDHKERGETKLWSPGGRALRAERGRGRSGARRPTRRRAARLCRSTPPSSAPR